MYFHSIPEKDKYQCCSLLSPMTFNWNASTSRKRGSSDFNCCPINVCKIKLFQKSQSWKMLLTQREYCTKCTQNKINCINTYGHSHYHAVQWNVVILCGSQKLTVQWFSWVNKSLLYFFILYSETSCILVVKLRERNTENLTTQNLPPFFILKKCSNVKIIQVLQRASMSRLFKTIFYLHPILQKYL